jgi:hypothetical protein
MPTPLSVGGDRAGWDTLDVVLPRSKDRSIGSLERLLH